jgi:hypothetical protein
MPDAPESGKVTGITSFSPKAAAIVIPARATITHAIR